MLRKKIKRGFDKIMYSSPLLNKIARNINRSLSSLTSFRLRPFGILSVKLKSGLNFKMATNETSSVTKLLFWNGPDNYEYTSVFERLVKQCTTFMDIGANTGYYSLLAIHANPQSTVFSFEPATAPYTFLRRNVQINRVENYVHTFQLALSDRAGILNFFELDNSEGTEYNLAGTGTLKEEDMINHRYLIKKVNAQTLDEFLLENKIKQLDLIKLDTEGTEHIILAGAHKTLSIHKPIIICETLFNVIERELETIMLSYGYQFFNYNNGSLQHTPSIIRDKDNGVRDVFFVHPEKLLWIEEFLQ